MSDPQEPFAGESSRAFAAYAAYRDLGPRRSQQRAAQVFYDLPDLPERTSAKLRQITTWSARFDWVARAHDWDAYTERQVRADQVEQVQAMRQHHASTAAAALDKVEAYLDAMSPADMTPSEMTRLFAVAVKVERLSRCEPDTIAELAEPNHGPMLIEGLAQHVSNEILAERLGRLDHRERCGTHGRTDKPCAESVENSLHPVASLEY